ncbi:MAG: hypothetical protein KDB90_00020 [Planctomycetes bacterium]|nr:hypothetical protein [Planctomycetota bacterium]
MTLLQRRIRAFRLHLMFRLAGYSALMGLLVALVLVIAAPWLRDQIGLPGYWLTIALPLALPALYVVYTLFHRPNERTIVLAADAWCGAEGAIVSAHELEREHPDSPFIQPVVAKALAKLEHHQLPEPRLMRKLLVALAVMLALLPLSRFVHAQMEKADEEGKQEELARKVDVPPKDAEDLAKDAAATAEKAKELRAKQQEQLADDIEQAARNAQAGGGDKERALREANSLADRARAQTESQQRRDDAREALKDESVTSELAKAIENTDSAKTQEVIDKLVEQVHREDGSVDIERAKELRAAIEKASKEAPQDARLRRAAEALAEKLDPKTLERTAERRQKTASEMAGEGLDPEAVADAMKKLQEVDKRALEQALEELSKSASPLRDLDVNGKEMEELLKQIDAGKIDPEQAKQMAEAARQLSERLELDSETLKDMLKEGKDFGGLQKAAEEMLKKLPEGAEAPGPDQIPEWAKDAIPEEIRKEWEGNGRGENPGEKSDGQGHSSGNNGGEGDDEKGKVPAGGKGGDDTGTHVIKPIEGEGTKEGVDTTDTGQGKKDPDKDPEKLDPKKAAEEKARREATGRKSDSSGINTRDEEERLPRRYRDAARKYFERD